MRVFKNTFYLLLALLAQLSFSAELLTGEAKYMQSHPKLIEKVLEARELLNQVEWDGDREQKGRQANQILRGVLSENSSFAPVHREFYRLYWVTGQKPSFFRHDNHIKRTLKRAIKLDPAYLTPQLDMVLLDMHDRSSEKYRERLSHLESLPLAANQFNLVKLKVVVQRRDPKLALKTFHRLAELDQNFDEIPVLAAQVEYWQRNYQEADRYFDVAAEKAPQTTKICNLWFDTNIRRKDYDKAEDVLSLCKKRGFDHKRIAAKMEHLKRLRHQ